jgi:hypothetical protein
MNISTTAGEWKATVGVAEHLGSDTFLHVHADGAGALTVRADGEIGVHHGKLFILLYLLGRQGVQYGVTVTAGGNGFFAYRYMLRRTMIYGTEDLDQFKAKLATFARTAAR